VGGPFQKEEVIDLTVGINQSLTPKPPFLSLSSEITDADLEIIDSLLKLTHNTTLQAFYPALVFQAYLSSSPSRYFTVSRAQLTFVRCQNVFSRSNLDFIAKAFLCLPS
jgi:hypothetical protein